MGESLLVGRYFVSGICNLKPKKNTFKAYWLADKKDIRPVA